MTSQVPPSQQQRVRVTLPPPPPSSPPAAKNSDCPCFPDPISKQYVDDGRCAGNRNIIAMANGTGRASVRKLPENAIWTVPYVSVSREALRTRAGAPDGFPDPVQAMMVLVLFDMQTETASRIAAIRDKARAAHILPSPSSSSSLSSPLSNIGGGGGGGGDPSERVRTTATTSYDILLAEWLGLSCPRLALCGSYPAPILVADPPIAPHHRELYDVRNPAEVLRWIGTEGAKRGTVASMTSATALDNIMEFVASTPAARCDQGLLPSIHICGCSMTTAMVRVAGYQFEVTWPGTTWVFAELQQQYPCFELNPLSREAEDAAARLLFGPFGEMRSFDDAIDLVSSAWSGADAMRRTIDVAPAQWKRTALFAYMVAYVLTTYYVTNVPLRQKTRKRRATHLLPRDLAYPIHFLVRRYMIAGGYPDQLWRTPLTGLWKPADGTTKSPAVTCEPNPGHIPWASLSPSSSPTKKNNTNNTNDNNNNNGSNTPARASSSRISPFILRAPDVMGARDATPTPATAATTVDTTAAAAAASLSALAQHTTTTTTPAKKSPVVATVVTATKLNEGSDNSNSSNRKSNTKSESAAPAVAVTANQSSSNNNNNNTQQQRRQRGRPKGTAAAAAPRGNSINSGEEEEEHEEEEDEEDERGNGNNDGDDDDDDDRMILEVNMAPAVPRVRTSNQRRIKEAPGGVPVATASTSAHAPYTRKGPSTHRGKRIRVVETGEVDDGSSTSSD